MRRILVLVALLALFLSASAVPASAAGASLVVSPTSIFQNEVVTLSMSGFAPKEVVSLWLTLPDYSVVAQNDVLADTAGIAIQDVFFGAYMPVGVYGVSARGNSSGLLSTAQLEVVPGVGSPASPSVVLTVEQSTQPQGECFDFTGAGFNSEETISVWLRDPDGSVSSAGLEREFAADSAGSFSYGICFGRLAAEGTYAFTAYGKSSALTGIVEFKLERGDYLGVPNDGAVLIVDPGVAYQLDTISVIGTGFLPGETVSIWITLPNGVVQSIMSGITLDGTFAEDLVLPPLPVGKHYLSAYGQSSGLRAVAELELLPGNGN